MRLPDKVALITGAGAGLGRTCALLLAREGAAVVVADIDLTRARATTEEIRTTGGRATSVAADVTKEEDVVAMIGAAVDAFGRIDVLHNNAGIPPVGKGSVPFEQTTLDNWNRVIAVNLTGVFLGCKHVVEPMRAGGGGSIVVTSSSSAFVGYPGQAVYAASKAGVNGLVRALAGELGKDNIRVNAVCPGLGIAANSNFLLPPGAPVKTAEDDGGLWDPDERGVPLRTGRPPQLIDSAMAALYLASEESLYISGQTILVDGGQLVTAPGSLSSLFTHLGAPASAS
jgi:NAD(P)-dependent dehydrogenase (short-subunit alcohol dehydrogenase family)